MVPVPRNLDWGHINKNAVMTVFQASKTATLFWRQSRKVSPQSNHISQTGSISMVRDKGAGFGL